VIVDEDAETGKRDTIAKLAAAGIRVHDSYEQPYSLEDVFIVVVEKARKLGKVTEEA